MSTHLISDETITPTSVDASTNGAWLRLSAAITDEVPVIADREDLVVTIAPEAGQGSPACFMPAHARIEINGAHLGRVDPATAAPHRVTDRARYAAAWGLLTHECAHAAHSVWEPPTDTPPGVVNAAMLLEESRIEAAQIRRRPDDRHWLRASATNLILADLSVGDPEKAPRMTAPDAAHAAALLLARVDAGILTAEETTQVRDTAATVLGEDTLAALRQIWRTAHTVGDDDTETMIQLGRRWCETIGTDPDAPSPGTPDPGVTGESEPGAGEPGGTDAKSALSKSIIKDLVKVLRAVGDEPVPAEPATIAAETEAATREAAESDPTTAEKVFSDTHSPTGATTISGTRPPKTRERQAARALARALTTAGIRDRAATKTTSPMPPGRLRMRGALAADAQRAAGAVPTAEPFTRTIRRVVPAPPLRLGIACDVSGSMKGVRGPVASTAWILAHAAHHTQVPATSATVIFGTHVRPITYPGVAPKDVTTFDASDGTEDICGAIDALDGALGLAQPGAARLLVIVSDGRFGVICRSDAQARVNSLRAAGCGVLWLSTRDSDRPLDGVTVHRLTHPTDAAQAIGRAATAALRATR